MSQSALLDTARNQLHRLGTLTDVVYAVALVLIIEWLPLPEESHHEGGLWIGALWAEFGSRLLSVFIGVVFVIIYWLRTNKLMSALDRTDGVHTALSIASVFFLLLLLYVVRVSSEVVAASSRAGESVAVALIGITAGLAWLRARKKGLVREGITAEERVDAQVEALAEPITALITLPLAYVSPLLWNLGWLAYIPVSAILKRRSS